MEQEIFSMLYVDPRWWEKLFSKYKGGRLYVGPGEYYEDVGGYAWDLMEEDDLYSKFHLVMEPVANDLKQKGNYVEYNMAFCHLFVRFLNKEEAKAFDKVYYKTW